MLDTFSNDITAHADKLRCAAVFAFMDIDYIQTVVKRAVLSHKKAAKDAREMFESAVNKPGLVKVSRFPNQPSKAPPPFLVEPVLKAVLRSDKLAGAILKIWAESHEALGEVVVKHLGNLAMPAEYPDFSEFRFRSAWFSDAWTRERDNILERHSEFDKDDVALMLCYVSGKIPGPRESAKNDALSRCLKYMRVLPANASEWERGIPEFFEELNAIREVKATQRDQASGIDAAIAEIKDAFSAVLAFFQRDGAAWSVAHLDPDADLAEALREIGELQSLLTEYQPVADRAAVLSEERVRRQKRAGLENRILPVMDRIDELMCGDPESEEDPLLAELRGKKEKPPTDEKRAEQPEDDPVAEEPEESRGFSDEEYESLQSENQRLEREVELLHDKLREGQDKLREGQDEMESWRVAYIEAASRAPTSADEEEPLPIENVHDAVELAKEKYEDRLLFQLNAKSRVEDNPFRHPKAVWDALTWLATTYYEYRRGERELPHIDQSVREACKWWYRGHQSNMTMNKYKDWYTTKVNGQVCWLHTHIGTGRNKNARFTIRIGFDWDKHSDRVIVGFIGQHQQTDAT